MTSNKTRLVTLVRVHLGQETIVTNPSSNRHGAGCDQDPVVGPAHGLSKSNSGWWRIRTQVWVFCSAVMQRYWSLLKPEYEIDYVALPCRIV